MRKDVCNRVMNRVDQLADKKRPEGYKDAKRVHF